jgi:hypothetical protein
MRDKPSHWLSCDVRGGTHIYIALQYNFVIKVKDVCKRIPYNIAKIPLVGEQLTLSQA